MQNRVIVLKSILVLFFVAALFAAVTDFAEGRYITASWIAFAGVLSVIGAYWRSPYYVFASFAFWAAALMRLYFFEPAPLGFVPVFNARFFLFLLAAVFLSAAYVMQKNNPLGKYMAGFACAAMITIIIGSLKENYNFVMDRHYRNLGYSYVLTFYAALFFAWGLIRKQKLLRISGIVLAALVVLKLYLHDIWTMSRLVKIIAGFSLGIAMVTLSIIYQKFHDRIFPKKGPASPALILAAAVSLILIYAGTRTDAAAAETFRSSNWHYYKNITGSGAARTEGGTFPVYGRFFLDNDMIRYGSGIDYRVTLNGRPLPHMTRVAVDDPKLSGSSTPEIIFHQADRNGGTYVLRLPDPPAGSEYSGLEVNADNKFEASAQVEIGRKAGEWEPSGNYSLFSYQGTRGNIIKFNAGDRRFIRIRISSRQNFYFPKAYYTAVRKHTYYTIKVPLKSMAKDIDGDRQGTVYYYENSGRKKISRLVLTFEDQRYDRSIEIYAVNPPMKVYDLIMTARLSRTGGDSGSQIIDLYRPVTGSLKMIIVDKDDKPLTLTSVTAYVPREELIFELPPREEWKEGPAGRLRLYYGNPYSLPPVYDMANTFDQKLGMIDLTPSPQTKNEAFAYSVMEPPVSTWVIRIVFLIGLAVLAYPAWLILRDYTGEVKKPQE
jgi:hypothetical protein